MTTVLFWIIKILTMHLWVRPSLTTSSTDKTPYRGRARLGLSRSQSRFSFSSWRLGVCPVDHWLASLMVAVFGTMAADVLHVEFGVPYVRP